VFATVLATPAVPSWAGHVVADPADGRLLEAVDADVAVESRLVPALLVVELVRGALATGALKAATPVAIEHAPGGATPDLGATPELPVGELLQLLLLTGSPTAARSLAGAVEPESGTARGLLLRAAARLGLTVSEPPNAHGPVTIESPLQTTTRDLARLGMRVAADADLRRRLDRDGVPIADGHVIVRATAPLIATRPPSGHTSRTPSTVMLLGRESGLEVLVVATGASADGEAATALAAALATYERVTIVGAGQEIGPAIEVPNGIIPSFRAVAAEPFALTARAGAHPELAARLQLPAQIEAPVDVRQTVGELVLEENGAIVAVVPLVAPRTIAPRRWLDAAAERPHSSSRWGSSRAPSSPCGSLRSRVSVRGERTSASRSYRYQASSIRS
jgi:D-alanyl-D-alanine carboxypeptidase